MSGCDYTLLPEFVGVPTATLQQWLTDAQTALQALAMGNKAVSLSYSQMDGSKAVTYTQADIGRLEQRVRALAAALGLTRRRRAIGVRF